MYLYRCVFSTKHKGLVLSGELNIVSSDIEIARNEFYKIIDEKEIELFGEPSFGFMCQIDNKL